MNPGQQPGVVPAPVAFFFGILCRTSHARKTANDNCCVMNGSVARPWNVIREY